MSTGDRARQWVKMLLAAVLAVSAASVVHSVMLYWSKSGVSFLPFFGAVMVAAWFCGLWPGVIATVLSAVLVMEAASVQVAAGRAMPGLVPRLILFSLEGALISFLTEELHVNRRQAHKLAIDARHHAAEVERHAAELAATQQRLEHAGAAKDHFLAMLSHELRTPLTPILGAASLLEKRPDLPLEVRADLSMIRRNAQLQARLVDDLLDLTRITHGRLELQTADIDAHQCLHSAVEVCQGDLQAKGLRLILELSARQHHLHADGARLQQVFWNLLKNAVKFTPVGGEIRLRSCNEHCCGEQDSGDTEWFVLEFRDTGIGIAPADLERIFDTFEQGGAVAARQFGGLGLGLAIGKAMVERHGGTITAASDGLGHGAVFTVRLPAVPVPSAAAVSGAPVLTVHGRLRILLVEDHLDSARLMCRMLESLHCEVTAAHNFSEALAAADRDRFNLVISDLGLPDGSGLDLMRELKHRHGLCGIALSGFGQDHDRRDSAAAGFCEHMVKPVDLGKLREVIEKVSAVL